jgi:DNA-binding response OmpR family regulator
MTKILIIDDEAEFRDNLLAVLNEEGYETESAASAADALARRSKTDFDVILLDFMMPGMNGIDALTEMRKRHPRAKVIMMTAFATVDNAVDAIRKGAAEYICKPFKIKDLLTTIRRVLEQAKFEKPNEKVDLDRILNSISSPIRRNILSLLNFTGPMRLMEITRELAFEDHTKVVFHLKMLREAGIIEQKEEKLYSLTPLGIKMIECLKNMEDMLLHSPAP